MDTFNLNQMPPIQGDINKKSVGPLIAVVIILALIIVGGLYFLKERSSQPVYTPISPTAEATDSVTDTLNQQGTSDDLGSIEADLKATDVSNIDQGAAAIDAQLQ
jgi:hypothetical protein